MCGPGILGRAPTHAQAGETRGRAASYGRGVFRATTVNDKVMYILLGLPIMLGMVLHQVFGGAHGYDHRETISASLRSLFMLQPRRR